MKKSIIALFSVLLIVVLAACGGSDDKESAEPDEDGVTKLVVGASSVPHGEVLEEAKPMLEEENIELEIEPYEDYVLPNDDLDNGTLDANYFQHIPYLEQTIEDTGYDLTHIGGVHIEPMGVYSTSFDDIDEVPDGTDVLLSNSVADHGRILGLFENEGIITLKDDVDLEEATLDDIEENPKDLEFVADVDPAILPEYYEKEKDTLVVINTNYAIEAGLNPLEDALIIEGEDSPYVNVLAVRSEDEDNEALNKLIEVLHSEEIQDFITEKYEGAVVPVSN